LSRPANITPINNIVLAGDFTVGDYPSTLEGAVMSGINAAKEIISSRSQLPSGEF
jgi:uncharacterized protein with NAD-binding domain and iron-sulfur cluster